MGEIVGSGVLLLLAAWCSVRRFRYLLTPSTVFVGVWFVIFVLYALDPFLLHLFSVPVTGFAAALHLASLLMVLAGAGLATLFRSHRPLAAARPDRRRSIAQFSFVFRAATASIIVVLACVVAYKVGMVLHRYGDPFAALCQVRYDLVHGSFHYPLPASLTTLLTNLALLNLGVWLARRQDMVSIAMVVALLVLAFLNDLATADQEGLRLVVLLACAVYYAATIYWGSRLSPVQYATWATALAGVFCLFLLVGVLRAVPVARFFGKPVVALRSGSGCVVGVLAAPPSTTNQIDSRLVTNGPQPRRWLEDRVFNATFRHVDGDIVGNYVSSSWFIAKPLPSPVPGANTLSGFYTLFHRFVGRDGSAMSASPDPRFYANIVGVGVFNTTDYIAIFYSDFGLAGALILSAFMGAGAQWVFLRARDNARLADTQALALVTMGLFMSVRGNYFGAVGFWFTLLLVYAQERAFGRLGEVSAAGAHLVEDGKPRV
ncbi:MAG TPA: O-antigen polymerase [bacterium]|nr:O-antigen polymerase [bacterium]